MSTTGGMRKTERGSRTVAFACPRDLANQWHLPVPEQVGSPM